MLKPINNQIICKIIPYKLNRNGIILLKEDNINIVKVVAIGEKVKNVKVNDNIFLSIPGMIFNFQGEKYMLCIEDNVIGIIV